MITYFQIIRCLPFMIIWGKGKVVPVLN